jgi:hypothetical protein
VQYLHFFAIVVVGPNTIPLLVVPNLAPQEVPTPVQNESGDVNE